MTARTRCGWVKFWECSELLYGRRCHLMLNKAVYRSYVVVVVEVHRER